MATTRQIKDIFFTFRLLEKQRCKKSFRYSNIQGRYFRGRSVPRLHGADETNFPRGDHWTRALHAYMEHQPYKSVQSTQKV